MYLAEPRTALLQPIDWLSLLSRSRSGQIYRSQQTPVLRSFSRGNIYTQLGIGGHFYHPPLLPLYPSIHLPFLFHLHPSSLLFLNLILPSSFSLNYFFPSLCFSSFILLSYFISSLILLPLKIYQQFISSLSILLHLSSSFLSDILFSSSHFILPPYFSSLSCIAFPFLISSSFLHPPFHPSQIPLTHFLLYLL